MASIIVISSDDSMDNDSDSIPSSVSARKEKKFKKCKEKHNRAKIVTQKTSSSEQNHHVDGNKKQALGRVFGEKNSYRVKRLQVSSDDLDNERTKTTASRTTNESNAAKNIKVSTVGPEKNVVCQDYNNNSSNKPKKSITLEHHENSQRSTQSDELERKLQQTCKLSSKSDPPVKPKPMKRSTDFASTWSDSNGMPKLTRERTFSESQGRNFYHNPATNATNNKRRQKEQLGSTGRGKRPRRGDTAMSRKKDKQRIPLLHKFDVTEDSEHTSITFKASQQNNENPYNMHVRLTTTDKEKGIERRLSINVTSPSEKCSKLDIDTKDKCKNITLCVEKDCCCQLNHQTKPNLQHQDFCGKVSESIYSNGTESCELARTGNVCSKVMSDVSSPEGCNVNIRGQNKSKSTHTKATVSHLESGKNESNYKIPKYSDHNKKKRKADGNSICLPPREMKCVGEMKIKEEIIGNVRNTKQSGEEFCNYKTKSKSIQVPGNGQRNSYNDSNDKYHNPKTNRKRSEKIQNVAAISCGNSSDDLNEKHRKLITIKKSSVNIQRGAVNGRGNSSDDLKKKCHKLIRIKKSSVNIQRGAVNGRGNSCDDLSEEINCQGSTDEYVKEFHKRPTTKKHCDINKPSSLLRNEKLVAEEICQETFNSPKLMKMEIKEMTICLTRCDQNTTNMETLSIKPKSQVERSVCLFANKQNINCGPSADKLEDKTNEETKINKNKSTRQHDESNLEDNASTSRKRKAMASVETSKNIQNVARPENVSETGTPVKCTGIEDTVEERLAALFGGTDEGTGTAAMEPTQHQATPCTNDQQNNENTIDHWCNLSAAARLFRNNILDAEQQLTPEERETWKLHRESSLLHLAVRVGSSLSIQAAQLLVSTNMLDVNLKDNNGQTPLFDAVSCNRSNIVSWLLSMGASVNEIDNIGASALHMAVLHGYVDIAQVLVDHNADVNASIKIGNTKPICTTPLNMAVTINNIDMVRMLCNAGANINALDSNNLTPLQMASGNGYASIVAFLLEAGADVSIQTPGLKRTAFHFAAMENVPSVIELLLKAKADMSSRDIHGRTPLHTAAISGHLENVAMLVKAGSDIFETDDEGKNSVLLAISKKHLDVILYLLTKESDIKASEGIFVGPMHLAVRYNCTEALLHLVSENESEVDFTDSAGRTPLHTAATLGFQKMAEILLQAGCNVLARSDDNVSPSYLAERNGHYELCARLLKAELAHHVHQWVFPTLLHIAVKRCYSGTLNYLISKGESVTFNCLGASPLHKSVRERNFRSELSAADINLNAKDQQKQTPLLIAVAEGYTECVECLLRCGALPNIRGEMGLAPLHIAILNRNIVCAEHLLFYGAKLNIQANGLLTPLHIAVLNRNSVCVDFLLYCEPKLNIQDQIGHTPLHIAVKTGYTKCVERLLHCGADHRIQDKMGKTPLHVAVMKMDILCVDYLLRYKAKPNIQDSMGLTPLHIAVKTGYTVCVERLLRYRANPSIQDEKGKTALHIAVKMGYRYTICVKRLLHYRANLSIQDKSGQTALHIAVKPGYTMCVHLLLEKGANPNVQDKKGHTPLHIAVKLGFTMCVHLLLEKGANPNIQDEKGHTPLHIAVRSGDRTSVEQLLPYGAKPNIQDMIGQTAIHFAISSGQFHLGKSFGKSLAKEEMRDIINILVKRGKSVLYPAVAQHYLKAVSICIEDNVLYLNAQKRKTTATQCFPRIVWHSVKIKMNIPVPAHEVDWSAHGCAEQKTTKGIVRLLIKGGVNRYKTRGLIKLCCTTEKEYEVIVRRLFEWGASLKKNCSSGRGLPALRNVIANIGHVISHEPIEEGALLYKNITTGSTTPVYCTPRAGIKELLGYLKKLSLNASCQQKAVTLGHAVIDEGQLCLDMAKMALNALTRVRGDLPAHLAAAAGDIEILGFLFNAGVDLNRRNSKGWTCLHSAAHAGNEEVVAYLIKSGMNTNTSSHSGLTPLHLACQEGNIKVVRCLIENGANINTPNVRGNTPLHVAATKNHGPVVDCLIATSAYCNLNIKHVLPIASCQMETESDKFARNSVSTCECMDRVKCIMNKPDNREGWTLLHKAVRLRNANLIKCVLTLGASTSIRDESGNTPLLMALALGDLNIECLFPLLQATDLMVTDRRGNTPLHLAVENGQIDIVQWLVVYKRKLINVKNKYGETAFQVAAGQGNLPILDCLHKAKSDVNVKDDCNGWSPLHASACAGQLATVDWLLKNGAVEKNVVDKQLLTPLHLAVCSNNVGIVMDLIKSGADIQPQDVNGWTPLHMAVRNGNKEIVRLLAKANARLDIAINVGRTPLHIAAKKDHIMETLIQVYDSTTTAACINAQDRNGDTALGLASMYGGFNNVTSLLSASADITIANHDGQTPLDIAISRRHSKIVGLLIKAGADVNRPNKVSRDAPVHLVIRRVERMKIDEKLTMLYMQDSLCVLNKLLNANAKVDMENKAGQTALHMAINKGYYKLFHRLLCENADLNKPERIHRNSPLHLAVKHLAVVGESGTSEQSVNALHIIHRLLEKKRVRLNLRNDKGDAPIHIAVSYGLVIVMRKLIDAGARVDVANNLVCQTPLHLAVLYNGTNASNISFQMVRLLLDNGCKCDPLDMNAQTPLHIAAKLGREESFKLLVERGADLKCTDSNGKIPLDYAESNQSLSIAYFLMELELNNKTRDERVAPCTELTVPD